MYIAGTLTAPTHNFQASGNIDSAVVSPEIIGIRFVSPCARLAEVN